MTSSIISTQDNSEGSFNHFHLDLEIVENSDRTIRSIFSSVTAHIERCDFDGAVVAIQPL
ncbi:MAG: hypothetical protein K1060chlam2_00993, partial [Chlamydiae bacterium]|nr:hypothetical protein [Chlamydiota bacterium]